MKTIKELKALNTKNLLRYYRAERNRMYKKSYRYIVIDENDQGNLIMGWNSIGYEKNFVDDINYINKVKAELDSREHVERTPLSLNKR